MESEGLNYFVIAARGGPWLAGFQYREWAEDWRKKYCATGLIVTQVEWVTIQSETLREERQRDAMKPRPNGGIRGERLLRDDEWMVGGPCD